MAGFFAENKGSIKSQRNRICHCTTKQEENCGNCKRKRIYESIPTLKQYNITFYNLKITTTTTITAKNANLDIMSL